MSTIKTIFYKKSENEEGDHWFHQKPYKVWFELEGILYEQDGNIVKKTIVPRDGNNYVKSVVPTVIEDRFSDEGIIRRIALNIAS